MATTSLLSRFTLLACCLLFLGGLFATLGATQLAQAADVQRLADPFSSSGATPFTPGFDYGSITGWAGGVGRLAYGRCPSGAAAAVGLGGHLARGESAAGSGCGQRLVSALPRGAAPDSVVVAIYPTACSHFGSAAASCHGVELDPASRPASHAPAPATLLPQPTTAALGGSRPAPCRYAPAAS
jgi:hypothetical protein